MATVQETQGRLYDVLFKFVWWYGQRGDVGRNISTTVDIDEASVLYQHHRHPNLLNWAVA